MKTDKNILTAFILNLSFSVFEFFGGIFTGSTAIVSDAVHDAGDAASIGIAYFLERKSKKQPDKEYTYGYTRYSVIGAFITDLILLISSALMIYNAVCRIIAPNEINYSKMIVFALVGVFVNLCAAFFTGGDGSLNQKAVNLHMLEDVLGWAVVLAGAVTMKLTDLVFIDPIMSMGVSLFILKNAIANLKEIFGLFLEKAPHNIDVAQIKESIMALGGVIGVHHIHIWSMDGQNNFATMHIVTDGEMHMIKLKVRKKLSELGIGHATLELETSAEHCDEKMCHIDTGADTAHNHHGHHH